MSQKAVFLDRDNTLIEDPGFISDPEQVRLLPGAADAVRSLRDAGYRVVVTTNQSGVARGLVDEATLQRIHDRLKELLAEQGAPLDALYYCPYLPGDEAVVEAYRRDTDLRKPKPGMLLKAAKEMDLDLSGSWAIGDEARDVEAGRAAGCPTVLITSNDAPDEAGVAAADYVVADIAEAAKVVLEHTPRPSLEAGGPAASESVGLLREVVRLLRSQKRQESQGQFSLGWLTCVVVQVVALAVGFRAMLLLADQNVGACIAWFLFACFLQVWALTLAVISRSG